MMALIAGMVNGVHGHINGIHGAMNGVAGAINGVPIIGRVTAISPINSTAMLRTTSPAAASVLPSHTSNGELSLKSPCCNVTFYVKDKGTLGNSAPSSRNSDYVFN